MQDQTNKDQETIRAARSPIHVVPTGRQPGASADALRDVHMSLVRAEQNLYNLVQANQANGQAAYGFAPPAAFAAGYAAPAFPPGLAPTAALGPTPGLAYAFPGSFAGQATPWTQAPLGALAPWTSLAPGFAAYPAQPGPMQAFAPYGVASRTPACDITDEGKAFVCLIDLPGLRAEDVDLQCSEHSVVITASREADGDAARLVQAERATAIQQRTILLPNEVLPGGAKAQLSNGILTVTLPKVHPTEGPRRIKIQG